MESATLRGENLTQFCPTTNLYECSDGRWLLISVVTMDVPETLGTFGVRPAVSQMSVATNAAVFLSDEDANVLDADGDPANGMTPLQVFPHADGHSAILAALEYIEVIP